MKIKTIYNTIILTVEAAIFRQPNIHCSSFTPVQLDICKPAHIIYSEMGLQST